VLAVLAELPDRPTSRPPIVLVHGAANSAWVWPFWQKELSERGWPSFAISLRGHFRSTPCDLSRTTMQDYADDVSWLTDQLASAPVLLGWSMGGLVAMLVAAQRGAAACVALAPSLPARKADRSVELRTGEYGPEEYGITDIEAEEQPAMPDLDEVERAAALASMSLESRLAQDERRAGVVIESLPCPLLIATSTADALWPRSRYDGLHLPANFLEVDGASHWGLVLSHRALRQAVPAVVGWLEAKTGRP